jgi:ABC-2 type transport system permease protein
LTDHLNSSANSILLPASLEKSCEKNPSGIKESWIWKYTIKDEKLGNSIFLIYDMKWDEAMTLLKRGTINVLIIGLNNSVEYHFDPMNPDAQLTYLKLSTVVGKGEVQPVQSNSAN